MPRAARFKIAAIEQLLRQLEYAPAETRRRQMDAAERLIGDVDPHQNYPEDFIIFRVTGYRPDRAEAPVMFVGQALLPDLVNLVQTLSESLDMTNDHSRGAALTIEQVAARLSVSLKTIQRYRKQGLVCHYVVGDDGVKRLCCFEAALARFTNAHGRRLERAATFTRLEPAVEAQLIAQARQLRETERLSLNEVAWRLSRQVGRAHETIRSLLQNHDRRAAATGEAVFAERGPLTPREIMLIRRAWERGIEPAQMARRFKKTRPTIHRAINRGRRDRLRTVRLQFVHLPTFDLPDAAAVILAAPAVTEDLAARHAWSGAELTRALRAADPAATDAEDALIAALNLLKKRAAESIACLGDWPATDDLDAIETDLRWASLLRRKLILMGLPTALRRIEQNFHRPLSDQANEEIIALVEVGVEVVARAADSIDPGRGQQLSRVVALTMDKELAKIVMPQVQTRAAARRSGADILFAEPARMACLWDGWLNLRRDLLPHVANLSEPMRRGIELRYGLAGSPPLTMHALAAALQLPLVKTVRTVQQANRELRAMVRAAAPRA